MQQLTRQQLTNLVILTLVWGINWPVLKVGVTHYPGLSFRTLSILLGLPVLAAALVFLKVPFRLPRRHWPELLWLTATNILIWNVCIIMAVKSLSSGRAAILGYTMPIFSALLGAVFFSAVLSRRAWAGVAAAGIGVCLLLWHEITALSGSPGGVALALLAAAVWALGTQLLRKSRMDVATLTLSFWMTAIAGLGLALLAVVFERDQWHVPNAPVLWATVYNAVLIFGYAHAAWFYLARGLPPVASSLSVMFIPILGVFSGALWLGEVLHWQDWAAVFLMAIAIASVLLPPRTPRT
jgi:drug/metabolite transporter (DMT)-like permease